jgi:cytochrome c5
MLAPPPLVLAVVSALAPGADLEAKVKAIFEESCTACHDDGDDLSLAGAPSRLTATKSAATSKPLVVAGNPDASYLYAKVAGAKGISGEAMPPGDPLSAAQKKAIKDWIAALKPEAAPAPAPAEPAPSASSGGSRAELEAKVRKLFDDKCSACHEAGGSEVVLVGDLSHLTRDKSPDAKKVFVVPGDPDASYLVNKLTGKNIKGDIMPMGDDPLSPAEIEVVRQWIVALAEPGGAGGGGAVEFSGDDEVGPGAGDDAGGGDKPERGKPPFHGTFQINLPTTTTLGRRTFEFRIDHRFGQVGAERGAFGLDAGANISFGFAYGILDGWDVLLRRTNSRKGYELGTKYIPIRQEDGYKLSFGGYASVEYLRDFPSNTANPWAGNFQLLISRLWFDRWSTQLSLGYHLRTNHAANVQVDLPDDDVAGPVAVRDKRGTLGLGIASTVWLGARKRWGIDLEYHLPIPSDVFFYRGGNADPNGSNIGSWSIGGSVNTGKHFFQIFLTNTREIHTNLYAPGGQSKNPFSDRGNFFLGFNLSRKWSL